MKVFMNVSKSTLKVFVPVLFALSTAALLAFFITEQVLVAASPAVVEKTEQSVHFSTTYADQVYVVDSTTDFLGVWINYYGTNVSILDASWAGNEMSQGCDIQDSSGSYGAAFYFVETPASTEDYVEVYFNNTADNAVINIVSFTNVDTDQPINDIACNSDTDAFANVTVNTQEDMLGFWGATVPSSATGLGYSGTSDTVSWETTSTDIVSAGGYSTDTFDDGFLTLGVYYNESLPYAAAGVALNGVAGVGSYTIYVDAYDDGGTIEVYAYPEDDDIGYNGIEWSLDGTNWTRVDEDDLSFGGYGYVTYDVGASISTDMFPPGSDVYIRVIDINDIVWPESGYVLIEDVQGNPDALVAELQSSGSTGSGTVSVEITTNGDGETRKVEYRVDGSDWYELYFNYYWEPFPYFTIDGADLPTGNITIDVQVTDDNDDVWGPYSINTDVGSATTNEVEMYQEGFNDDTGQELLFESYLTDVFYIENDLDFYYQPGSPAGRIRTTESPFTSEGLGALTMDGPVPLGGVGTAQLEFDVNLVTNIFNTPNLYMEFDYMWHDNGSASCSSCIQDGNKVYIRNPYFEEDPRPLWIEVYDLYANRDLGNYQTVSINVSEVVGHQDSELAEVRFEWAFEEYATSTTGTAGYSIDNLRFVRKIPTIPAPADLTDPVITVNDISPTIIGTGSQSINIDVTATEDVSTITDVDITYQIDSGSVNDIPLVPFDGNFDSASEQVVTFFTENFSGGETVTITITATSASGRTATETRTISSDGDVPTITFTTEPGAQVDQYVRLAGTATDVSSTISLVEFSYGESSGSIDGGGIIYNVNDGGGAQSSVAFDSLLYMEFLDEGDYFLEVRVVDSAGLENRYQYTGTYAESVLIVSNFGQERTSDTELTYTGSVRLNATDLARIQYYVDEDFVGIEVPLTDVTPNDGAIDSPFEEFTFTTPALSDGPKRIFVEYEDVNGARYFSGDFDGIGFEIDRVVVDAVDEISPIIELQPVVPNPIFDSTPIFSGRVEDDPTEITSNIVQIDYALLGSSTGGTAISVPTPVDGAFDEVIEEFQFESHEELAPGDYEIIVRAIDAAGNDTNNTGRNARFEFTVEEKSEVDAITARKTGDFVSHDDHDTIASDEEIWGRGRVRLQQYVEVASRTTLTTADAGPRYGFSDTRSMSLNDSVCGNGHWQAKFGTVFSYYDRSSGTEYSFDLADDFGVGGFTGDIVDFLTPGGDCHVWVTGFSRLVGIDFGTSITDGFDSFTVYDLSSLDNPNAGVAGGTTELHIDDRVPSDYGVYYRFTDSDGGVGYLKPGASVSSQADDQSVLYRDTGDYNIYNITDFYLDSTANELWMTDFSNGIVRIADNGTPLNTADDTAYQYDFDPLFTGNFSIGQNKRGEIFFAGNSGLHTIDYSDGTFDGSDDTIVTILTDEQANNSVFVRARYLPGDSIIGEQYFISTRGGTLIYYGTNDTPTDKLDDEFYILDVSGGQYPTEESDFIIQDENTITLQLLRLGVFDINLNRYFATDGTAISKVYAELDGNYLDINHIKLVRVDFIDTSGSVSYRVSIDGGFTWKPIEIGEEVFFTDPGYQIVFAMDMFEGSTPIISDFELEYSAYSDSESRGLQLDVEEEPDQVITNTEFSFEVTALDDLLNPLIEDQIVNLELRDSTTNQVVDTFNIDSALIMQGEGNVIINNAKAPVVGFHYIYAETDNASAVSQDISFVDPNATGSQPPTVVLVPSLTFEASDYLIQEGDSTILNWNSSNLENLVLSSDNTNLDLGSVVLNGTQEITLTQTTEFTLTGTGPYGNLESTLIVEVVSADVAETGVETIVEPPEITMFDAEIIEEVDEGWLVEVSWNVENADDVEITGVGENLSPQGTSQIIIDEDTTFTIIVSNQFGEARAQVTVDVQEYNPYITPAPFLGAAVLTALGTLFLMPLSGSFPIDFLNKFGVLFGVVGRRKKKYWGFIIDKKTSEGIAFAVINIFKDSQLIGHTVSDLDGKYTLLVESGGKYTLEVKASGYKPFKEEIQVKMQEGSADVVEDVSLSRVNEKEMNILSKIRAYKKADIIKSLFAISAVVMLIGFVYTVIITTQYPNAVNFLLLIIYGVFFSLNILNLFLFYARSAGKVIDADTKQGVSGASVRFYKDNAQAGIYLTNKKGVLKINLASDKYEYVAHKNGYKVHQGKLPSIEINEKGYLSEDIAIKKA